MHHIFHKSPFLPVTYGPHHVILYYSSHLSVFPPTEGVQPRLSVGGASVSGRPGARAVGGVSGTDLTPPPPLLHRLLHKALPHPPPPPLPLLNGRGGIYLSPRPRRIYGFHLGGNDYHRFYPHRIYAEHNKNKTSISVGQRRTISHPFSEYHDLITEVTPLASHLCCPPSRILDSTNARPYPLFCFLPCKCCHYRRPG